MKVSEFRKFLGGGWGRFTQEERTAILATYERDMKGEARDFGTGSAAAGSALVPQEFAKIVAEGFKSGGDLVGLASIITSEGGMPMPVPTLNDTASAGEIVAENASLAGDSSTPFGQVVLKAFTFGGKLIKASLQFLADSTNAAEFITRASAARVGRLLNNYATNGTGTGQPRGLLLDALSGKVGTTGQTASVIYDDLVDLVYSVDPAYRSSPSCGFMCNDATAKALRKLKDTANNPLWNGRTILGFPVYANNDMPNMAANAKPILFGDFSQYAFRMVGPFQILRFGERYLEQAQIGFVGYQRADGALLDAGAGSVKFYQNSAT